MDRQDIQKVVYEKFIKPFKGKAEKATTEENLVVEKQADQPKKGNMKRGKKS